MKIKSLNILKRAVPAVATAVAISGLYVGVASASTNTIASSDISLGDTITISAGYYGDDTIIQIPTADQVIAKNEIPGIKQIKANYYTGGDNSGLNAGLSASKTSADVSIEGVQTLNLGINESVTMPKGYYFNDVTIRNNVANRGSVNWKPSSSATYTMQAGYYKGGNLDSSAAYSKGVTDADNRANSSSANYIAGYNAGVEAADARANGESANYKAGYAAGVEAVKANPSAHGISTGPSTVGIWLQWDNGYGPTGEAIYLENGVEYKVSRSYSGTEPKIHLTATW